jgi:predicted alpha/beta-hydrolase family hydrolase
MRSLDTQQVTIEIDDAHRVSGLLLTPERARACYVLAHGAGAGMAHPFMAAVADALAQSVSVHGAAQQAPTAPSWRRRRFELRQRKRCA